MDAVKTITITSGPQGAIGYSVNGSSNVKFVEAINYFADSESVTLLDSKYEPLLSDSCLPEGWTINGVTGFTTSAEVVSALAALSSSSKTGVATGEYTAVLSDTEDLPIYGWIRPMLLAGNIKYVTEKGEVRGPYAFDLKEASLVRVRRVWLTGTTADMGIVVIY